RPDRFSAKQPLAHTEDAGRPRLGAEVAIRQPAFGRKNRDGHAAQTQSGSVGQPDHVRRAGLTLPVLLRGFRADDSEEDQAAPDELLLHRRGVLQLSPAAGLSGRPRLYPRLVPDLLAGLYRAGRIVPAAGRGQSLCVHRSWHPAIRLSGPVLLHILLRTL